MAEDYKEGDGRSTQSIANSDDPAEDDPTSCIGSRICRMKFTCNFCMAAEWLPDKFGRGFSRGLHALVVHARQHVSTESSLS